ncbi:complement decay-accelerating factor isoform X2 [Syngnathoides biaculeatus]|nr:complement decay-accelerating factor isoform X2 [Syngnathoides biaculeatus]
MNTFPAGSKVTLVCRNGFQKASGSDVISCRGGAWTPVELVCKKMDCGVPEAKPHMEFNTSGGTLFGAVVVVTCQKGYQINGPSYKQCYTSGWSGTVDCHVKTCSHPPEVTNGNNSWHSQKAPTYGQAVRYHCDEGYALAGNDTIQCDETGQYDSPPPECKAPASPSTTAAAADRDNIITGGAEVTTRRDGGRAWTTTAASDAPPWPTSVFQGAHDVTVDGGRDIYYVPVIIIVIGVSLVACTGVLCLHLCHLRRKGSYDTREDAKPQFLIFQNV